MQREKDESSSNRSYHQNERPSSDRSLLVRSESRRIRRLPSLDYTPPNSQRSPVHRRNSYSTSDHSIVYVTVHEHEDDANTAPGQRSSKRPPLEHSSSAPASGFRRYLPKFGRKGKELPRHRKMPSLSESQQNEPHLHDDENQPLLPNELPARDFGSPPHSASSFGASEESQQLSPSSFGLTEESYLLHHDHNNGRNSQFRQEEQKQKEQRLYQIALAYLLDFQASRASTLPPDSDYVSDRHLFLHWLRFSQLWNLVIASAMASLFYASGYENAGRDYGPLLLGLTFFAVAVFIIDMVMMKLLFGQRNVKAVSSPSPALRFSGSSGDGGTVQAFLSTQTSAPFKARKSRSRWWALPLSAFLVALSVETAIVVFLQDNSKIIWTSAWKPIVLFYASPKARNALDAMNRVARIVFKVLFMELFLIFTFGAVACQLYVVDFDNFGGLATSFLSMYEISTLVATPGLWMPIFDHHPTCAIFFVLFLVTCVFYLHSLVLSVVFQSYMEGLMIIRDHAASDKEETIRLAFQTLYRTTARDDEKVNGDTTVVVHTKSVRKVFMLMRPKYGREKINALVNIVDPSKSGYVDYNFFRSTMPKAMITSVRTARPHNRLSMALGTAEAFLAIANLVYVVLASSTYESSWWMKIELPIGEAITILCIGDLFFRLTYSQKHSIPEAWSPDVTFDLVASVAVIVSVVGLFLHRFELERSMDWLITGRAIDMMRFLRLASEARGIVRRSGELLPYVVGPVVLVVAALHMLTYLCMAIWGGTVVVGRNTDIPPFYDLNNFNSYTSGLMTMFNMLVANDWHLLAKVFVLPSHPKTSKLVYPFFIGVNLIIVSILLNVLTAFFVGAFVTRTSWKRTSESRHVSKRKSSTTVESGMVPLRPVSVRRRTVSLISSDGIDDESTDSSSNDITMSERQDFDDVLKATMGKGEHEDDAAKYCCHLLELFETLGNDGQDRQLGYLVSCQQSMSRYGNQRFQQMVHAFMGDETLHSVIDEMHAELARSPSGHEMSVHRRFQPPDDQDWKRLLELTASIVKEGSSVALFLAKVIDVEHPK